MTPGAPPTFEASLAPVAEVLGPPNDAYRLAVPLADTSVSVALWGRAGGENVCLRVYDDGAVMLVAERFSSESHAFPADGARGLTGAAEDARAWLGWGTPA